MTKYDGLEFMKALGTKYALEILQHANDPASARELSEALDIPIATTYRRIEALQKDDLLIQKGRELSEEGRREHVYQRTIDEATITFTNGDLEIETTDFSESRNSLIKTWDTLRNNTQPTSDTVGREDSAPTKTISLNSGNPNPTDG